MNEVASVEASRDSAVKSAKRVIDILEYAAKAGRPIYFSDVVRDLKIPKTSVHALLKTLAGTGFLVVDDNSGYRLGLKVFELGAAVDRTKLLVEAARPILLRGAAETHCTCNLGILEGKDVYYVDKVQHPESVIQIATRVGGRLPAYATAMGKVLLGGLDPDQIDEFLSVTALIKLGPGTILDREELRRQIFAAKLAGFAIDDEESHANVVCVAAAVRDSFGMVIAAASITGLKATMLVNGECRLTPIVIEMAKAISKTSR
jgi:DNA-binding IclR family transcriptional regulator